jgi:hypothetical protein
MPSSPTSRGGGWREGDEDRGREGRVVGDEALVLLDPFVGEAPHRCCREGRGRHRFRRVRGVGFGGRRLGGGGDGGKETVDTRPVFCPRCEEAGFLPPVRGGRNQASIPRVGRFQTAVEAYPGLPSPGLAPWEWAGKPAETHAAKGGLKELAT